MSTSTDIQTLRARIKTLNDQKARLFTFNSGSFTGSVSVSGNLTLRGDIKNSSGASVVSISSNNLVLQSDLILSGGDIKGPLGNTRITLDDSQNRTYILGSGASGSFDRIATFKPTRNVAETNIEIGTTSDGWLLVVGKHGGAATDGGFAIYKHSGSLEGTGLLIDKNKNVTVYGNLKFWDGGEGIDFSRDSESAGMTSELLDDYEEGTWTPYIYAAGGLVVENATGANAPAGRYTKIGNLVFIEGNIKFKKTTSPTPSPTHVTVAGLPFTSKTSTSDIYTPVEILGYGPFATSIIQIRGEIPNNTAYFTLGKVTGASTTQNTILNTDDISSTLSTDNHLRFSAVYITT